MIFLTVDESELGLSPPPAFWFVDLSSSSAFWIVELSAPSLFWFPDLPAVFGDLVPSSVKSIFCFSAKKKH